DDICGSTRAEQSAADLAAVLLERNLTSDELPEVAPVYTNPDFYDRACNSVTIPGNGDPGGDIVIPCASKNRDFFGLPLEIVGYDGTAGTDSPDTAVKKHATVPQDVSFTWDTTYFWDSAAGWWIRAGGDSPNSMAQHGDSGGPITFRPAGG